VLDHPDRFHPEVDACRPAKDTTDFKEKAVWILARRMGFIFRREANQCFEQQRRVARGEAAFGQES
jgi:hypothetical protein